MPNLRREIKIIKGPNAKNLVHIEKEQLLQKLHKMGWMSAEQKIAWIGEKIGNLKKVLKVAEEFDAKDLPENLESIKWVNAEIERLEAEKARILPNK